MVLVVRFWFFVIYEVCICGSEQWFFIVVYLRGFGVLVD